MYIILEITDKNIDIIGLKEDLAYYCEKYGDIKFINVDDTVPEQIKLKQLICNQSVKR